MYNSDDLQNSINSSILVKRFMIRNNILNLDIIRELATSTTFRSRFNTLEILNVDLKGTDYCVTIRVLDDNQSYMIEPFIKQLLIDQIMKYYNNDLNSLLSDLNAFFSKNLLSDSSYFNNECIEERLSRYLSSMFFIEKYPQNIYIIRI